MKKPYIKLLGLTIVLIAAGLIVASLKSGRKFKFETSAEDLHRELVDSRFHMDPNTAREIIAKKNSDYVFIDIRNPGEYDNFHIEGAINVPAQRILDDAYIPYLKNNKKKVLYSNESIKADQVRVLLTQYGYHDLYVLQGGANYWKENMLSGDVFKTKAEYDDEKLTFDPEKLKKAN